MIIPPHVKKYSVEKIGDVYRGYAIFKAERKVFRAEVEVRDGVWVIRGVPFFDDGIVRLYEMEYDPWDRRRYVLFYPWDSSFGGRRLLDEFEVGVRRVEKVVSYYGVKNRYGGGVVDNYVILSNGETVEVYDGGTRLLARVPPRLVESVVYTPLGEINRVLKR